MLGTQINFRKMKISIFLDEQLVFSLPKKISDLKEMKEFNT